MTLAIHPSRAQINDFCLGRLSADESETIGSHVIDCDTCRDLALTSPDDDLVSMIRNAPCGSTPSTLTARTEFDDVRFHAQGGLGIVTLAHDRRFRRDVAVKRMKPSLANDPSIRRRFLREAAITARLEHPGIAPVYGLGEDDSGQPFYSMRFVPGETMQDAIRNVHRDLAPPPSSLRPLLMRFVSLCQTVSYAHSRGVVHRDIKPSNVAIGTFGETILLDWGLAYTSGDYDPEHHLDASSESLDLHPTKTGTVLGTPGYMAPEQSAGSPVGPAADIFSLGVTLHAILTGALPGSTHRAAPPSLVDVARKAMAPSIFDRYGSAAELGADVDRWLAGQALEGVREHWTVRAMRTARRHQLVVTGIAAALFVAMIALAIATTFISRKNSQLQDALSQARDNETRATENFRVALESVNTYTVQVTEDTRLQAKDLEPLRKKLLIAALDFYRQLLADNRESPLLSAKRSDAHQKLGTIQRAIGDYPAAERELDTALSLVDHEARNESREYHMNVYNLCTQLSDLMIRRHDYPSGLAMMRRASQAYVAAVGPSPNDPNECEHAMMLLRNLAVTSGHAGLPTADVDAAFSNALVEVETIRTRFPNVSRLSLGKPSILMARGEFRKNRNLITEAEADFREAWNDLRKQPDDTDPYLTQTKYLAEISHQWGMILRRQNRLDDAAVAFESGIKATALLVSQQPHIASNRADRAYCLLGLATIHMRRDELKKAEPLLREAIPLLQKLNSEAPSFHLYRQALMNGHTALARALLSGNQINESLQHIQAAEILLRPGPFDIDIAQTLTNAWCRFGMAAKTPEQFKTAFEAGLRISKAFVGVEENKTAIDLLMQMKSAGLFNDQQNSGRLKDPEFDQIRSLPSFQKLK